MLNWSSLLINNFLEPRTKLLDGCPDRINVYNNPPCALNCGLQLINIAEGLTSALVDFRCYGIPKVEVHQIAFGAARRPLHFRNEPPTAKVLKQKALTDVGGMTGGSVLHKYEITFRVQAIARWKKLSTQIIPVVHSINFGFCGIDEKWRGHSIP